MNHPYTIIFTSLTTISMYYVAKHVRDSTSSPEQTPIIHVKCGLVLRKNHSMTLPSH